MVSSLSISGLSYFENPRSTHNQCEESRKVWGQYFHEHGNVIQNICKKSEEAKRKAQTHQTGQTLKNTLLLQHAYLHFLASESSLVLEIKTKPHQLDSFQTFLFLEKYIYPFLHANRILPHMPVPSAGENNTLHTPAPQKFRVYFEGSPFNNHVIVAAATVASWFPTPTPLREAWVAKVPERELEKAWKKSEQQSVSSWWVTLSNVNHLTCTVSQNWYCR